MFRVPANDRGQPSEGIPTEDAFYDILRRHFDQIGDRHSQV